MKSTLKKIYTFYMAFTLIAPLFAKDGSGRTGAGFLRLGASAKGMAMGEAYSALVNDATAIYWNPGALAGTACKTLSVMHGEHIDDSSYQFLGYAQRIGKAGYGIGVQNFNYGEIDQLDLIGESAGSLKPKDLSVALGYARAINGYRVGATIKHIQSELVDSDSTQAFDIGMQTPKFIKQQVTLAATVANIGGHLNYENQQTNLPLTSRIGSAFRHNRNWDSGLDFVFPKDEGNFVAVGTEYRFPLSRGAHLALRGGYNTKEAGAGAGMSGGMGFRLPRLDVDFALVGMGDLGLVYRISADFRFCKLATYDSQGRLDSDSDGVADELDQCPDTSSKAKVDDKGCPLDTDGDGVADFKDNCADTPKGTKVDEKGCKLPIDTDKDGVWDDNDECPNTVVGTKVDSTGCAENVKKIDSEMNLSDVNFDLNSAEINDTGRKILDEVVETLKARSAVRVEVQGHTDSWGEPEYNMDLSSRRAFAVKSYLILKGISAERLDSTGYGENSPIDDNGTPVGRAKNRRIEFRILGLN